MPLPADDLYKTDWVYRELQEAIAENRQREDIAARAGWLPADDLTGAWQEQVQQVRAEADAADRERLLAEPTGESQP